MNYLLSKVNGIFKLFEAKIDYLNDVDTTTVSPNIGDLLVWDGTNWIPQRPRRHGSFMAGFNGNAGNDNFDRYLEHTADGLFLNNTPFIVPFDCKVHTTVCATGTGEVNDAVFRVFLNGAIYQSFTKSQGTENLISTLEYTLPEGGVLALVANRIASDNVARPTMAIYFTEL